MLPGMHVILPLVQMEDLFAVEIVMASSSFGTLNERGSCSSIVHMIVDRLLVVFGIQWNHQQCSHAGGMVSLRCGSKAKVYRIVI